MNRRRFCEVSRSHGHLPKSPRRRALGVSADLELGQYRARSRSPR